MGKTVEEVYGVGAMRGFGPVKAADWGARPVVVLRDWGTERGSDACWLSGPFCFAVGCVRHWLC